MIVSQIIVISIIVVANLEMKVNGNENIDFNCGKRLVNHNELIKHGYEARDGDWPWHAAIYHESNSDFLYRCGGSVISSDAILTAAHCLFVFNQKIIPERVLVKLGKFHLKTSGLNSQEILAYKIIPHPEFSSSDLRNDIGIIRLSTEITFTKYVQPICLWDMNKVGLSEVINKKGTVIGWGITQTDKVSDILNTATMPVVSLLTCLQSNRQFYGEFLSDKNFCAGYRNGTSVCNGDSGGSMTFEENGIYRIRGIVSLSATNKDVKASCDANEYVVFTDVAKYVTWIEGNLPALKYSGSGMKFKSSGLITRNQNCDFYGGDITSLIRTELSDCVKLCENNPQCTHFTWSHAGTCFMKHFGTNSGLIPVIGANSISSCGYNSDWTNRTGPWCSSNINFNVPTFKLYGNVVRGEYCDFFAGDIGNKPATDFEECGKMCERNEKCTHFVWSLYESLCLFKNFGFGRYGLNTNSAVNDAYHCGFPVRQSIDPVPQG